MVPGNLERKIITNIKQFSYNFVVSESTLSASFHEKGHRLPGFPISCLYRKFLEVEKPVSPTQHTPQYKINQALQKGFSLFNIQQQKHSSESIATNLLALSSSTRRDWRNVSKLTDDVSIQ